MVFNKENKNEIYKKFGKGGRLVLYRYCVGAEKEKLFIVTNSSNGWDFQKDEIRIGKTSIPYEKVGKWIQNRTKETEYCYDIVLFDDDDVNKYMNKVRSMIKEDIFQNTRNLNEVLDNMENNSSIELKGKVYICSPLSDIHPAVVRKNAESARRFEQEVSQIYHCRALAPHGYLPFLLDDNNPTERKMAIQFDKKLLSTCDSLLICSDRISKGMKEEIYFALENNIPVYSYENYRVSYFDESRL